MFRCRRGKRCARERADPPELWALAADAKGCRRPTPKDLRIQRSLNEGMQIIEFANWHRGECCTGARASRRLRCGKTLNVRFRSGWFERSCETAQELSDVASRRSANDVATSLRRQSRRRRLRGWSGHRARSLLGLRRDMCLARRPSSRRPRSLSASRLLAVLLHCGGRAITSTSAAGHPAEREDPRRAPCTPVAEDALAGGGKAGGRGADGGGVRGARTTKCCFFWS